MGNLKDQTNARTAIQSSHHRIAADAQRTSSLRHTANVDGTKHILVVTISWTCRWLQPSPGMPLILLLTFVKVLPEQIKYVESRRKG